MKKLTKLRLKEFHEMNDSEMKSIRGGYDGSLKKCSSGTSDEQCIGLCEEKVVAGETHTCLLDLVTIQVLAIFVLVLLTKILTYKKKYYESNYYFYIV